MNNYEEKRQAKIDYYKGKATQFEEQSESTLQSARSMASVIPFGQPILVGHHSEGRDRKYRAKITNTFERGFGQSEKAKYYAEKAAAAENNKSISSDDPDAETKLKEKIEKAQKQHEIMKKCNAIIRKNITDEEKISQIVEETGLKKETVEGILKPDWVGRIGFAPFMLTNSIVNISRMKKRIEAIALRRSKGTKETEVNGITVIENTEENRCQVFFPEIPSTKVRTFLKAHGFRWSRYHNCWQRHMSNAATYYAEQVQRGYE